MLCAHCTLGVVDVSPSSCLCQVHQKEALSHLKQWPKDEEGEPAQKKGRREEGEMRLMEPRGDIQVCVWCVCVCVCGVCTCVCVCVVCVYVCVCVWCVCTCVCVCVYMCSLLLIELEQAT